MTEQQIHEHLDAMLANPKTRNFLNHLVRAYFPITNVEKVWNKPKGPFKCVITGDNLFSTQDILEGIQSEQFKNDFIENLKSMFDDKVDKTSPMIKLIGDRKMGVTGQNTTTYMSYNAVQEFYNWVLTKALKNDKHINWLLRSIRKSSMIERAETIEDAEVQEKIQQIKKQTNKVATYTLGETDTFKKLKEKFKD